MAFSCIGTEVKVETTNNDIHIGRIYACDEESKILVLFKGSEVVRDFIFLNTTYIKNIVVTDSNAKPIDCHIEGIDNDKLLSEIEKKIAKEMNVPENVNSSVSAETQMLFNELAKTNRCEWEGVNIKFTVLDVSIIPPYKSSSSVIGSEPARSRIVHILPQLRARLNLD